MRDTFGVSLSVVLADDHRLTANALADSMKSHKVNVLAVAHSVPEAMALTMKHQPDVLVTDLDMGVGPSGLDLVQRVRKEIPTCGAVVLTAYEDPKLFSPEMPPVPDEVVYLVKQRVDRVEELIAAVELARRYATREEQAPRKSKRFALTQPQAALLRLVAQGLSNQAIAAELSVTHDSVAKSINRLAKRFQINATDQRNVRVALTQRYFDYVGFQRDT